ncbi:Recombinase [Rhodococcus tukisamuensis]|uniref:Recombinase n=1 Tax=Rhodococcus tukisamuensis TaxID=168276 RepID=A0A1G6Y4Y6_9NOCA|nr:Recombinase [Rhodococcus tukisamuensis]
MAHSLIRRRVNDVLDVKPTNQLARDLKLKGYLTPSEYYASVRSGGPTLQLPYDELPKDGYGNRKPKRAPTSLRNLLRNKSLRGYIHHNGETVHDDEGRPIQLADPMVTLDEWELVQGILDRKQEYRRGIRRPESSPLAGVAVCLQCGMTLHRSRHVARGHEYRYYRCENPDTTMIPAELLE